MKHKLLILTRNPVAKVGIASYLSSLFGQYLTIVSTRIADLKPEDMEDAGCILYTTGELKEQMPFSIPDSVKQLVCMRTFNHTYLQRILQIPPGSFVYLVNDTVDTTYEIMETVKRIWLFPVPFSPLSSGYWRGTERYPVLCNSRRSSSGSFFHPSGNRYWQPYCRYFYY